MNKFCCGELFFEECFLSSWQKWIAECSSSFVKNVVKWRWKSVNFNGSFQFCFSHFFSVFIAFSIGNWNLFSFIDFINLYEFLMFVCFFFFVQTCEESVERHPVGNKNFCWHNEKSCNWKFLLWSKTIELDRNENEGVDFWKNNQTSATFLKKWNLKIFLKYVNWF